MTVRRVVVAAALGVALLGTGTLPTWDAGRTEPVDLSAIRGTDPRVTLVAPEFPRLLLLLSVPVAEAPARITGHLRHRP